MSLRTLPRHRVGRIYHRDRPYKHIENSKRGARLAVAADCPAIDWDEQITADGVIVICHDNQPLLHGFFDPLGRFRRDFKISEHTWAQVSRLLARTGVRLYRIQRIEPMLAYAHRLDLTAVIEPKANHRFAEDWVWQYTAEVAEEHDTTVSVRGLRELGGVAHIAAAKRAGFQAWLI